MRYSNSKLNTVLTCPMSYYLKYEQEISRKEKPKALFLGSAVHHGLEMNTIDLTDFFQENGNFKQKMEYSDEQLLAESMLYGYSLHKDEIYNQILSYNNEKLELLEESHELELYAKLPDVEDEFFGIIDLLLLTNKGFIILDYKTSSEIPDWDKYLEQIYRYIFLIRENFPEVPILKIGIINLRKCQIRKKKNENDDEFRKRIKFEYELNDENYISYHEYLPESLNEEYIKHYIENIYKMCDAATNIINNRKWYINFSAATGVYKSQYLEIFNQVQDAHVLYEISDKWYNGDEIVEKRDCVPIDMLVIYTPEKIINKYSKFKEEREKYHSFKDYINSLDNMIYDMSLLNNYEEIYKIEGGKQ